MASDTDHLSLARYGLIGDCRTTVLFSDQGSINWLCAPDFDSPSIFARLLDARRGGHFAISPRGRSGARAAYLGHSAALETTFCTAGVATKPSHSLSACCVALRGLYAEKFEPSRG